MWTDSFGFLGETPELRFEGGEIVRLSEFQNAKSRVDAVKHGADGFVYPRQIITRKQIKFPAPHNDPSAWEDIPRSERPGLLHALPPSHEIRLEGFSPSSELRTADGGFMMHLLGYLYGLRPQFQGWWLDMRIPTTNNHGAFVTEEEASEFLSHAYRTWRGLSDGNRQRVTNALFMNARGPCYEWEWEQFNVNYMVFDALYRVAVECHGVPEVPHAKRFKALAANFRLAENQDHWKRINSLRNELFHEALWDGSQPGMSGSLEASYAALNLREINHRLIPAVLTFETKYVESQWWILGNFAFVERNLDAAAHGSILPDTQAELERVFTGLRRECIWLRNCWNIYRALYEGDERTDASLTAVAGHLFVDLNRILIEYVWLQACKVTDPASSAGQRNLTFKQMNQQLAATGLMRTEIRQLSGSIERYREEVLKGPRDKRVSHLDLDATLGEEDMGAHDAERAVAFFEDVQGYCDEVGRAVGVGPLDFRSQAGSGDVLDLIRVLRQLAENSCPGSQAPS